MALSLEQAEDLRAHRGDPKAVTSVSIAHASTAVDETRHQEPTDDPELKGLRWALLKDPDELIPDRQAALDALLAASPGNAA